jgi:hypothetical protein
VASYQADPADSAVSLGLRLPTPAPEHGSRHIPISPGSDAGVGRERTACFIARRPTRGPTTRQGLGREIDELDGWEYSKLAEI